MKNRKIDKLGRSDSNRQYEMSAIANLLRNRSLLAAVAVIITLICTPGRGEAYDCKTDNVLQACGALKREHIFFGIYNINAEPACVFKIGDQYWFYDGEKGSNTLNFLPEQSITSDYSINENNYKPINSCLIEALISYTKHVDYKINAIVFLKHHAMNIYSNSNAEFARILAGYPVVAVFGAAIPNQRVAGISALNCVGCSL